MMQNTVATLALAACLSVSATAQLCTTQGDRFLKIDGFPQVPPPNPTGVGVICGLNAGEAGFNVFDNVSGQITINEVSVLVGAQGGVQGSQLVVDVEFYDGVTENTPGLGQYQLGPLLWDLSNGGNANAQVASNGFNVIDLVPFNVQVNVTSGKLVVAVRVDINPSGPCPGIPPGGHSTNLGTDFSGFGGQCPTPGTTGIISLNNGAFDPATYPFPGALGLTLCNPLINAYGGTWGIRACITEAAPAALTSWQGFPQPGGAVLIQLNSPGTPNDGFVTLLGGGINVGTATPWGTWPIDLDQWTLCFLGPCRGLLSNSLGFLDGGGQAITTLLIPNDPSLVGSGLTWYATYFAHDPLDIFNWTAIGAPSDPIVIN